MSASKTKTVLVIGADGYMGNAIARAFVRAGWTTYGLVRNAETRPSLRAEEIITVLGSAGDKNFVSRLATLERVFIFDVIIPVTEQILDYVPHFNNTIELLRVLATMANGRGVRPLVLCTSGCEDYGMTGLHGSEGLAPHTEESPLNPPPFVMDRATYAVKIFDHTDLFDAVLLRPTGIYGYSSIRYGPVFDKAARAAEEGILKVSAHPRNIIHGTHIDDCAQAYLSVAKAERDVVRGQCYNISGDRYETLEEIMDVLVKEYNIANGVKYLNTPEKQGAGVWHFLFGFSQWVDSSKLRRDVGWKDKRQTFSKGLHIYRKAYEAAIAPKHGNMQNTQAPLAMTLEGE